MRWCKILALVLGFVHVGSHDILARGLEKRFPELKTQIHRLDLLPDETPLESWSAYEAYLTSLGAVGIKGKLWIKRDDLSFQMMGGNKARKLEYILGEALNDKIELIETFGAWGSNHAYATTMAARQLGIKVELHLGPQPVTDNVRKKLLANYALGATMVYHQYRLGLGVAILRSMIRNVLSDNNKRHSIYLPPGGSNPLGTLGYVDGMLELVDQFATKKEKLPQEIVVPMGTAGTSAGLLVGSCLAGVMDQVKIVAVGISHDALSNERLVRRLAGKTHHFLAKKLSKKQRKLLPKCNYDRTESLVYINYTYPRYGEATERTKHVMAMAKEKLAIELDPTYSGKAFAYYHDVVLNELNTKKDWTRRLFWMTYNSYSLDDLIARHHWTNPSKPWLDLPKDFHQLFEKN